MNKAIIYSILIFITAISCKSLSPYFSKGDLLKNGKYLHFRDEKLTLERITPEVTNNSGIGLYTFVYRRNNDELLLPVLRFNSNYIIFKDDKKYVDSVCNSFTISNATFFTEEQLKEIKRRFANGLIYSGLL